MPNGNPWDHSDILLSNNAGANWGRGIEQVGRAFGQGIQEYYQRKEKLKKEEDTVDWLNQNEAAVNQLFPQLAQVKDPDERKKVIKAGIKGAGLENLIQVKNFTEQQRRQKQMEGIQQEMAQTQLAGAKLQNQHTQSLMDERATEERAVRAAASPTAGIQDQIMRGTRFADMDPNAEVDRGDIYLRNGGRSPQMIAAMAKSRPFSPQEMMTPSGLNMVQTSPSSYIPDPRVRQKPGKAAPFDGGPEYSKDKKYFRSGPDDTWKPVRAGATAKMDPVQMAEFNALPGEIAELEQNITKAAGEARKGNKKPGPDWMPGFDTYDEKIQKMQGELEVKKRRLKELGGMNDGADDETTAAAPARKIADPFSYVLGG
jgi:hypothetical protein